MRELRFRVWNPDEERMMYFMMTNIWFPDRYLIQHRYDVQQFTGLHDWTAREIYEGDLLEFAYTDNKKFVGKVEYEDKFACFVVVTENAFVTFSDLADYDQSFEVIGNIFESPELLK
jgi:uncharacterized phage protein (TIGR01671 family)